MATAEKIKKNNDDNSSGTDIQKKSDGSHDIDDDLSIDIPERIES